MKRGQLLIAGIIGLVVLAVAGFFVFDSNSDGPAPATEPLVSVPTVDNKPSSDVISEVRGNEVFDWQRYNIDYMNDGVKNILINQLGANGRTAFYLPVTGYVNVPRGTKYGVAFAIQNVDPKVPEGNEFSYNFKADPSSVADCGVSVAEAQSWIERGWASSGMISGQWREDWNEWYDAMTIYFSFPAEIEPCNVKYNFIITKDGNLYDSKTIEFNLV